MSVYSPAVRQSSAGMMSFVSIGAPTLVTMTRLSSREVLRTAAVKARQLAGLGMGHGSRVAVALPPGLEFAALLHAMPLLGSVLVPLNTRDPAQAPAHDLLVDAPPAGPEADVEPHSPHPEDTWVVLHTSGTTAAPKAVELTYGNFRASAEAAAANLPLTPGDRWLCVLPLFHVGGLSILTRSAFAGSTAVVHERFDADAVAESLESGEATVVSLVGTMLRRLQERGLSRAPALRAALVGGGPVPSDLIEWGRSIGLPLLLTYGMTETCSQIATAMPGDHGGYARPLPGVELEIGSDGEILIRGPMVARSALAADGWLHSGDRGRLDANGYLWVDGRIKDTIVTGGENVAAGAGGEAVGRHPAGADRRAGR